MCYEYCRLSRLKVVFSKPLMHYGKEVGLYVYIHY